VIILADDDLPRPPEHVFSLATPAHMLVKLHWEISGLKKALSGPPEHIGYMHAPSYHAYNIAVTVWHMTDWVWKASSAEQRTEMFASLGIPATGVEKKDFPAFQNTVRRKSHAIHICRQVATGSKHVTVTKYPDPNVRVEMRWECASAQSGEIGYQYRLVISDNGKERPALDVFKEAFKDWERYLGAWGFTEGTPVVGTPPTTSEGR
jgi:hypothetical protein